MRHKTSVNGGTLYQLRCDRCSYVTAWYSTLEKAHALLVNHQRITHRLGA